MDTSPSSGDRPIWTFVLLVVLLTLVLDLLAFVGRSNRPAEPTIIRTSLPAEEPLVFYF